MGIQELHYDTDVWGQTPDQLEPNRFVQNPKLAKHTSYRPWGGGHSLCPGRFLARRLGNAYITILLSSYDIHLESSSFPRGDGTRPSPGVLCVGQDEDVLLKLTRRTE
jgi:cholesterol 7alpha-monooxygenase